MQTLLRTVLRTETQSPNTQSFHNKCHSSPSVLWESEIPRALQCHDGPWKTGRKTASLLARPPRPVTVPCVCVHRCPSLKDSLGPGVHCLPLGLWAARCWAHGQCPGSSGERGCSRARRTPTVTHTPGAGQWPSWLRTFDLTVHCFQGLRGYRQNRTKTDLQLIRRNSSPSPHQTGAASEH